MTDGDERDAPWAAYLDTLARYYRLRRWFAEDRRPDADDILDQDGSIIPEAEDIAAAKAEVTRLRKQAQ